MNRVNQKHKQLEDIRLSAEQREKLDRWMQVEFVHSALKLERLDLSREQVVRMATSLRKVLSLARSEGKGAALTVELLIELHREPGVEDGLRSSAGDTARLVKPVPAASLPAILESACQWFAADSFVELHPIEQASIVFLRLIEIQPFEQHNESTAILAASLFTLRSGLPPIVIQLESLAAYRKALEESARMNTTPMVELIAEAVEKTLSEMVRGVE